LAERWMRLRDRQSVLAAFLLAAAYLGILCWGALAGVGWFIGRAIAPFSETFILLATLTFILLGWRLAMRFAFVAYAYGWREALRSPLRAPLGNAIAMLAAWRALLRYFTMRRTGRAEWGKTSHAFPVEIPAE
jgi:adsorption protein B